MFGKGTQKVELDLVKGSDFLKALDIGRTDLMKMKIEGGEYESLEHLIQSSLVKFIRNIQVQFHNVVPHAKERMLAIQRELTKTHALTYQYQFVWENWKLKMNRLGRSLTNGLSHGRGAVIEDEYTQTPAE